VQVALDPSQQGEVEQGDRAQVTLPGNTPVAGRVEGFGSVAQVPAGPDSEAADATIPTYIGLDDVAKARGLDRAPVQVDITTRGVENALSVPVTAIVGKSGGGFAVEVVRPAGDVSWPPCGWACSTPEADGSRSRARFAKAITWWCRRCE